MGGGGRVDRGGRGRGGGGGRVEVTKNNEEGMESKKGRRKVSGDGVEGGEKVHGSGWSEGRVGE